MFFSFPYLQRKLEASSSDTDIRHRYHTVDIKSEAREKEILFQNLYWQGGQDLHIIQVFKKNSYVLFPTLCYRTEILY